MKVQLDTSMCPIVCIGTYGTYLSPDVLFESDRYTWDEAKDIGAITEEEYDYLHDTSSSKFNFKMFLDRLGEYALREIEGFFKDIEHIVKIKLADKVVRTYSPTYYNNATDGLEYNVEIVQSEINKIYNMIKDNYDFFEWIYETYRTRSGFISFMPYTKDDFIEALGGKDIERALSMYLMWIMHIECERKEGSTSYQYNLIESLMENNTEYEFIEDERYREIITKMWSGIHMNNSQAG